MASTTCDAAQAVTAVVHAGSLVHSVSIMERGAIVATALVRPVVDRASADECGAAIEDAYTRAVSMRLAAT